MQENIAFNDLLKKENFNASIFARFLEEEFAQNFKMADLTPKDQRVAREVLYLVKKVGEIHVRDPELLAQIFKIV
jgi:hypothetical protein